MLHKIGQRVEYIGSKAHKIIKKTFQRNFQTVESKSAFYDGKLYNRSWTISDDKIKHRISQSYRDGKPIKDSKIDFWG